MQVSKELLINTGLAFLAGFATSFGTFTAATAKPPGFAVFASAAGAAAWAGFRFAVGFAAANAPKVPTIVVDE